MGSISRAMYEMIHWKLLTYSMNMTYQSQECSSNLTLTNTCELNHFFLGKGLHYQLPIGSNGSVLKSSPVNGFDGTVAKLYIQARSKLKQKATIIPVQPDQFKLFLLQI